MLRKFSVLLVLPLLLFLTLAGCEGPEGPAGADGPEGPGFPMYTYLGDNANTCGHCHSGTVEQWQTTKHSNAYATLVESGQENNPYCLHCHTVGFDSPVAYGDTVLTEMGPDHSGFDDYWKGSTAEDMERRDHLKNVQCENCHGAMGPTIYNHQPKLSYGTRVESGEELSLCAGCHDGQIEEWHESGHGTVLDRHGLTIEEFNDEWNRGSCASCHTAEGFIIANDPDNASMALPEVASMNGCVACHDPHSAANEHNLRTLADVTVLYDQNEAATMSGKGNGQLCAQCHHARRDTENVNGQIENGNGHFGPHDSPQMDMYVGSGCYEIVGYTYDRGTDTPGHYGSVADACVSCHMTRVESHGRDHFVHKMEPQLETCTSVCHTDAADAEDFDIHGKVTEINGLMGELIAAIGVTPEEIGDPDITTPEQRMAGYAYVFVEADGSHGIHNYRYTKSLLTNALAFMNAQNALVNSGDSNVNQAD